MLVKNSVTYSIPQIGQRVTARLVVTVTEAAISPVFRCDLRNDNRWLATWQEGGWTTPGSLPPGTWAFDVLSILVPSDWANGDSLSAQVVLEGQSGAWDSKSGLIIGGAAPNEFNSLVAQYA